MRIKAKSEVIETTRIRQGLSRKALAVKAKTNICSISKIEKDPAHSPTPKIAKRIADALDCNFDDLFEIVNEETPKNKAV